MVTTIIPTYKRSNSIDRAIQSVLNQTYKDIEIIVVDDNDPNTEFREHLEQKMNKYSENPRVKYIQHERNKNGAAARNTGIKAARGEYITFLDDDDYFLSKRLEILVNAMKKNTEYSGAYTASVFTKGKKILGYNTATKSGNMKKELLLGDFSFGTGSNMFFRSDTLKKLNGFDETFQRHQDIETMLRFFNVGELLGINDILVVKTQDDRTHEPDMEKYIRVKEHYFNSFKDDINNLSESDRNQFYMNHYLQLVYESIRQKNKKYYNEFLQKAKEYGKISPKQKFRMRILKINNYIKIEKIKYIVQRLKIRFTINSELRKEISMYENM